MEISAYSLIAVCNAAKSILSEHAAVPDDDLFWWGEGGSGLQRDGDL